MLPGCDSFCLGPFGDGASAKLCCRNHYAGALGLRGCRANWACHEFLDQLDHHHVGWGLLHGSQPWKLWPHETFGVYAHVQGQGELFWLAAFCAFGVNFDQYLDLWQRLRADAWARFGALPLLKWDEEEHRCWSFGSAHAWLCHLSCLHLSGASLGRYHFDGVWLAFFQLSHTGDDHIAQLAFVCSFSTAFVDCL